MSSDENVTPPSSPKRKKRSKRARRDETSSSSSSSTSSSSSDEESRRRSRKRTNKMSTAEILEKLIRNNVDNTRSAIGNSNANNVIPEFDPSNRAQTMDCWLRKVNECSLIYGWEEKQTIHFSLQKLSGTARRWYEALPSVIYTWEEWQDKLRKAFPDEENYARLLEEMMNRTSRENETLRDYFYDKLGLLTRCEIKGKKAVDCVLYGISDKAIRAGAQTLKCREPEDLLAYLCAQKPQSSIGNGTGHKQRARQNKDRPDFDSANLTCFNCQTKGHSYFKCPKPLLRCKRCNSIGHDNDDCKLPPRVRRENRRNTRQTMRIEQTASDGTSIDSREHRKIPETDNIVPGVNDKFYKPVFIDDRQFQGYIDFGSECTLMRRSDAELLNLDKSYREVPLVKGFGNSTVVPLYKSHVNVKIDDVDTDIEVLVVDDSYMKPSLIIGQNFTELPFITVLKDSKRLLFYKSPIVDQIDGENSTLKLFVTSPTTVSKSATVAVHTDSDYTGDILIDGYTTVEPGKEYCLFQGAYHLTAGKGEVVVSNLAPGSIKFETNTLIARSSPFVERNILKCDRITKDISEIKPLSKADIKVGPGLDDVLLDRLYTLLQTYRDCFATQLSEIGCAVDVEMKIEVLDNKPIVYRPYRLSHSEREKVRETVDELLQNDIIQESSSGYASPILMVKKKTGESRLCVDFRALNNKTVKDRFPLPIIDDQISNLSGNSLFTTLDLASGYYQVPMAKESRHLTAFVTPDAHYEFKRMPFGLANAPAVFQKMMNKILGNRRFEYALAYLDDVLIPAKNVEDMFKRLEDVLILFRQYGLTLKLSKCLFFDTHVDYLGYEISSEGIQPGNAKIQAVKEFPNPRNVHEIRQFLGLTGYFRKFIQGYGEIAQPLTALLKKDASWKWSDVEEKAFTLLKDRLISRPVLALYDPKLETELHTDASALGVGGILMQWQKDARVLKPVAYFSRQTTPEERHLHSYELETLAVVCSLRKFRVYLLGLHFKIFTDCAALRTTLTKRDLVPRIARWWLQISEYNFDIEYRPGVQMAHVDALSRNTTLPADPEENPCVNVFTIEKENWLLSLQLADPDISRIHKILKPEDDQECQDIRKNYVVKNHVVYRKSEDGLLLVIPRSARWQICRANHDDIGHLGFSKTLEKIKNQYWFPKLTKFVKKYVSSCLECAYNKDGASKQKVGHLNPIEKVPIPFHTIHIDHLGPFVKSKDGNTHILTVVDAFTKYVFVKAVKDLKTKTTIRTLDRIFYDFGIPARIVSDRGTSFTSGAFKSYCEGHGIKHVLNAVACPRANGQAERFNQTILSSLASQNSFGHEKDWDKCLGKIQWGINNTINASTQRTATEALFGIRLRDDLTNKLDVGGNVAHIKDLQNLRKTISSNITKGQSKMKERHDKGRAPFPNYIVGDLVKISRNNFDNSGSSTKLMSKFIGPYKITEVLGNDRYKITDVPGFNKKGKPYSTVIAADRIRPWIHIKALEVDGTDTGSSSEQDSSSEND